MIIAMLMFNQPSFLLTEDRKKVKTSTKGSQTESLEIMDLPESTRKELRDIGMHGM